MTSPPRSNIRLALTAQTLNFRQRRAALANTSPRSTQSVDAPVRSWTRYYLFSIMLAISCPQHPTRKYLLDKLQLAATARI